MNDRLRSRKNDTIKLPSTEQPIKYAKLLGAGCLTLASAVFPFNSVADLPLTTGAHQAEQADQQRTPPDLLQNMTVVALSTPDHPQYGQHDILSEMFTTATGLMSDSTKGYLQKPQQINVESHTLMPAGQWPDGKSCYTDKQLDDLSNDVRTRNHLPAETQVQIVSYSTANSCNNYHAVANAPGDHATYYVHGMSQGNSQDTNNFIRTIGHETGHNAGLGHSYRLGDSGLLFNYVPESRSLELGDTMDIAALYKKGWIKVASTPNDNKPNPYAGRGSVMGKSNYQPGLGGDIYNFIDLNTINPDLAPIATIDPTQPGEYVISLDNTANLRGVSIQLPADHPLRNMKDMPAIDSIAIGLNHQDDGDMSGTVSVIGRNVKSDPIGRNLQDTTQIDVPRITPAVLLPSSMNPESLWASFLVYRDSSMGFSVFAKPYKGPGQDYNSIMTLEVRPDSARDGALLAQ